MSTNPFGFRLPDVDRVFDIHGFGAAPPDPALIAEQILSDERVPKGIRSFFGLRSEPFVTLGLSGMTFADRPLASIPQRIGSEPGAFNAAYRSDVILQNFIALGREYSPGDVNSFRRLARSGDPRKYYAFLDEVRRLLLHSPTKRLYDGVAKADVTWAAPVPDWDQDENTNPKAVAARAVRDYERDQWRPWLRVINRALASAEYFGIAACRVETEPRGAEDGRERISLVEQIPARRFKVDTPSGRWVVQSHVNSGEWLFVDELVETGELIFWEVDAHQPLDQRGFGWVALIPWVIAQYTLRWYALKVELTAMQQRKGEFDPALAGHKELVEAALKNQAAASWIAYPKGSAIDMTQPPAMGGANDPHQTLWDTMRREIDLVALGHAQASDVRVGAGSVQSNDSAQSIVDERIDTLADEIAQGPLATAIRGSIARNFGRAGSAYIPIVSSRLKKPEDARLLSEVAVNLKNAGAGEAVSMDDLVRRCLGRTARDGERTLGAAAPTAKPAEGEGVQAAALQMLLGAAADTDPVDEISRRAEPRAAKAMEPLFAAIDRATDGDDLETIQRQLQQLAGIIGAAALEGAVEGVKDERKALGRIA